MLFGIGTYVDPRSVVLTVNPDPHGKGDFFHRWGSGLQLVSPLLAVTTLVCLMLSS